MKLSTARRNDAFMAALAVAIIVLDQLTKHWVVQYFQTPGLRAPVPIFGQVLTLTYVQNRGIAFSLFYGQSVLFVLIGIAVLVIAGLYWRMRDTGSLALKITFGMILGGALGNLVDRFTHIYVVDFIHFQIPGIFDFAVFNVADSGISVGVVLLAYLLWRGLPQDAAQGQESAASGEAPTSPSAKPPAPTNQASVATLGDGRGAARRPGDTSGVRKPTKRGE